MKKFKLNEPMISLIENFEKLIDYLSINEVSVGSKTKFISSKFLFELNSIMSIKEENINNRSTELSYPFLHLLSNLVRKGEIFRIEEKNSSKSFLKPTKYIEQFKNLKDTEKYIYLLETLWVDCDFEELRFQTYDFMTEVSVMNFLLELPKDKVSETFTLGHIGRYLSIIKYFYYFGLLTYKESEEYKSKEEGRVFDPIEITINPLGMRIINILCKKRELVLWNKAYRKKLGDWDFKVNKKFYLAFVNFFEEGELSKTINKNRLGGNEVYTFKVSLGRNNWCKIKLPSHLTFEDLHNCIQEAFEFDNDHMYAFFMDGKPWSYNSINCPFSEKGPYADKIRIKNYPLYKKQKFIYIFDFGYEWRFKVEVFDIKENGEVITLNPEILEVKGSVDQYD